MSTQRKRSVRRYLASSLVVAAVLITGLVYRDALRAWFGAEHPASAEVHPAGHVHGGADMAKEGGPAIAYWTCPMHPAVRKDGPGSCPICGMTLTPVMRDDKHDHGVVVDEAQRARVGIGTSKVGMAPMMLSVRALGRVTYDESKLVDVTLRVGGFISALHVDETGQPVKKGQPLFTLYSPELYSAQQEYLLARAPLGAGGPSPGLQALAAAARRRLLLLGMTESQVVALEQHGAPSEELGIAAPSTGFVIEKNVVDGAAVAAGERLYRIAPLDHVWVQAQVYEQDLRQIHVGQRARVTLPYLPGRTFDGTVRYVYPYLENDSRTGLVRIELANRDLVLKADMYADVLFDVPLGERLTVPASAVVYTGTRRLVFVDRGQGRLVPTDVELGVRVGEAFEVLRGLQDGDQVVTAGNFLVAAESRIHGGLDDQSEVAP